MAQLWQQLLINRRARRRERDLSRGERATARYKRRVTKREARRENVIGLAFYLTYAVLVGLSLCLFAMFASSIAHTDGSWPSDYRWLSGVCSPLPSVLGLVIYCLRRQAAPLPAGGDA